ncbi:hypothetical protein [Streptomyces sp. NPDC058249]|uniref:hypothetical protein n=1 Tax=Streptomyces sp. NPDC058249 TaxID=3346403 RepID=UPI0036E60804
MRFGAARGGGSGRLASAARGCSLRLLGAARGGGSLRFGRARWGGSRRFGPARGGLDRLAVAAPDNWSWRLGGSCWRLDGSRLVEAVRNCSSG